MTRYSHERYPHDNVSPWQDPKVLAPTRSLIDKVLIQQGLSTEIFLQYLTPSLSYKSLWQTLSKPSFWKCIFFNVPLQMFFSLTSMIVICIIIRPSFDLFLFRKGKWLHLILACKTGIIPYHKLLFTFQTEVE